MIKIYLQSIKLVFPNIKNIQMLEANSEEADPEAVWVTWFMMVLHLQFSGSSEIAGKMSNNSHLTCIHQQGIYSNFWSSSPVFIPLPFSCFQITNSQFYLPEHDTEK